MVFNTSRNVNTDELKTEWSRYLTTESIAPETLRGGLARARTRLLDSVPTWQLPAFLESLATEGATA